MSDMIYIEWLTDIQDCETCGSSWSEGAKVTHNGEVIVDLTPRAGCFGGDNYEPSEVYEAIIKHLGYDISYEVSE